MTNEQQSPSRVREIAEPKVALTLDAAREMFQKMLAAREASATPLRKGRST